MAIKAKPQYTTREVAEMLGVSRQTLQNWIDTGKVNPIRTLGGHYRFILEEINRIREEMNLPIFEEQP